MPQYTWLITSFDIIAENDIFSRLQGKRQFDILA